MTVGVVKSLSAMNGVVTTATGGTVDLADQSNVSASVLLGNPTGSPAAPSEITLGSGLSFSGTTLVATAGSGTVTSVDVSGGTTGLTFSGGPITTSGTITLAGTLVVANGGTGAVTLTNHGILLGQTTSAVVATAALTDGQLLVGQSSADPLPKTISGSGATITVSATGVITISAIANASLSNSSVTLSGHTLALGGTLSLTATDVSLGSVTNDTQTKAVVVPNTAPSGGQVLIGNVGGTAYAPQTVSGSGATITLSDVGVVAISAIANASLANSTVTISGHSLALGGSLSLASSDVSLGNVTNDAQTKAAVVPNTAPSGGQILVGNVGGTAYAPQTISGSGATITLSAAGVVTISAIANASLSNSSVTLSGHTLALGGTLSLTATDVSLGNVTNDAQTKVAVVPNTAPGAGQILAGNAGGTAYAPVTVSGSGATITLGATGVVTISAINVAAGGTGAATFTAHGILLGEGTSAIVPTAAMTDGQLLVGQSSADPLPKTISGSGATISLAATGVMTISAITVAAGGTGLATLTAHALYVGNGTSAPTALSVGATNTVLHGNTTADPSFSAVVEADLSLTNITTANVSTSAHGFVPVAPADVDKWFNGKTGTWGSMTVVRSAGTSTSGTPTTQVAQIAAAASTQLKVIVTYSDATTDTISTGAATASTVLGNAGGLFATAAGALTTSPALVALQAKDVTTLRVETLGTGTGTRGAAISAMQVPV